VVVWEESDKITIFEKQKLIVRIGINTTLQWWTYPEIEQILDNDWVYSLGNFHFFEPFLGRVRYILQPVEKLVPFAASIS